MREFYNGVTYNQLITFKAIVESGNISRAAKVLGISSASVSYSLKSLEQQIKHPLFIRSTRVMELTEAGNNLYESTQFHIDALHTAVENVADLNKTPSGKLVINIARDIYQAFLRDVLRQFQMEYPDIELELTVTDTMDNYIEEHVDIGFRFGETVNDNLIARSMAKYFGDTKVALFASPAYLEKHGTPQSIEQLTNHKLIRFRMPTSKQLSQLQLHANADQNSNIIDIKNLSTAMIVSNSVVMVDMTSRGVGLGIGLEATVKQQFDDGELVPVLQEHWIKIPTIYLYYAPENKRLSKVTHFLEFIERELSENRA
ncbi:LysR family transcriptional regulator [Psychrobium sp. MM17-31]|uniref:LysR family transcriptional regulator n=1 Tax=Psychrobium sp. MM17-31 TaxID=2917758 RepID=UPI001EF5B995|nr:LysR family transcriptional regulator [Psychrobium sp. MM17-31]MCG7532659.1 LysR family transcriptional regulator [Psychrobium sp. MM17-31]